MIETTRVSVSYLLNFYHNKVAIERQSLLRKQQRLIRQHREGPWSLQDTSLDFLEEDREEEQSKEDSGMYSALLTIT
jgi:hypothetical protein